MDLAKCLVKYSSATIQMKAPKQDFAARFAVLQKALLCFDTVDKSPRFNHSNKT